VGFNAAVAADPSNVGESLKSHLTVERKGGRHGVPLVVGAPFFVQDRVDQQVWRLLHQ
jgi:hypothetical protein